jgi:hypothetical protein
MEQLLVEERAAIRRLDSVRVEAIADEKERLFELFREVIPGRADLFPRLKKLVSDLRHNGVLLAHGRDCLRDAIAAARGEPPPSVGGRPVPTPRPGSRVSVTG